MPVELKSHDWRGDMPRPGDRMQVLAYCLLVEEDRGRRVHHGLLKYPNKEFTIPFGNQERQEIIAMLAEMNEAGCVEFVERSHSSAHKCQRCGTRSACGSEALA